MLDLWLSKVNKNKKCSRIPLGCFRNQVKILIKLMAQQISGAESSHLILQNRLVRLVLIAKMNCLVVEIKDTKQASSLGSQ